MKALTIIAGIMISTLSLSTTALERDTRQKNVVKYKKAGNAQFTYQLLVKFTDEEMHKSLLSTPKLRRLAKEKRLDLTTKRRLNAMHIRDDNQYGSDKLALISEEFGIQLAHLRTMAMGYEVLEVTTEQDIQLLVNNLKQSHHFSRVHINAIAKSQSFTPTKVQPKSLRTQDYNDPLYSEQTYFGKSNSVAGNIVEFRKNLVNKLGRNVRIGVVDSGSFKHEDMEYERFTGYSFLTSQHTDAGTVERERSSDHRDYAIYDSAGNRGTSGHGMTVASIIAAKSNNELGMTGVLDSNEVDLVFGNACDATSHCYDSAWLDAVYWMAGGSIAGVPDIKQKVDVINLSLGGLSEAGCYSYKQDIIDFAVAQNVAVVVAAGNEYTDAKYISPANCRNTITVSALNMSNSDSAAFTNISKQGYVDLGAVGVDVVVADVPENIESVSAAYRKINGTSQATPIVAAVIAGVKMHYGNLHLTPYQLEQIVKTTANPFANTSRCELVGCGTGSVDAYKSLTSIENLLIENTSSARHMYQDSTDTTRMKYVEQEAKFNVCHAYNTIVGSIGASLDQVEYKIYANGQLLKTVIDPQLALSTTNTNAMSYQVCMAGTCSETFSIDMTGATQPDYCL